MKITEAAIYIHFFKKLKVRKEAKSTKIKQNGINFEIVISRSMKKFRKIVKYFLKCYDFKTEQLIGKNGQLTFEWRCVCTPRTHSDTPLWLLIHLVFITLIFVTRPPKQHSEAAAGGVPKNVFFVLCKEVEIVQSNENNQFQASFILVKPSYRTYFTVWNLSSILSFVLQSGPYFLSEEPLKREGRQLELSCMYYIQNNPGDADSNV